MPFKSQKQRRFMHAKHPGIAQRWEHEAKKKKEDAVQKNDGLSAFGVDHGDFAKADKQSGGRRILTSAFPGYHAGIAGKKGKKLRAVGNELGGGVAGGAAGQLAGLAASRGRSTALAGGLSMAGAITGSQMGGNRNQRKGYLKSER